MIYIFRHQEGERHTNCLSKKGIRDSYYLTKMTKPLRTDVYIYTMMPTFHGKHVRPIQTATIMCTVMKKSLNLLEKDDIFPSNMDRCNHIIIWNHNGIPKILQKYFKDASFVWEEDNYDGCLIIHKNGWNYKPEYCKQILLQKYCCFC